MFFNFAVSIADAYDLLIDEKNYFACTVKLVLMYLKCVVSNLF